MGGQVSHVLKIWANRNPGSCGCRAVEGGTWGGEEEPLGGEVAGSCYKRAHIWSEIGISAGAVLSRSLVPYSSFCAPPGMRCTQRRDNRVGYAKRTCGKAGNIKERKRPRSPRGGGLLRGGRDPLLENCARNSWRATKTSAGGTEERGWFDFLVSPKWMGIGKSDRFVLVCCGLFNVCGRHHITGEYVGVRFVISRR